MYQRLKPIQEWWSQRDTVRAILRGIWFVIRNFTQYGTQQAAALAYYAIFSIFPLTLLLAVAIGNLLGPAVAQEQIVNGLELFLPEETVSAIQSILGQVLEQSTSFGVIAVVGLLWSALGLFSNVTRALDTIFNVPSSRSIWRQRLLAVGMSFTLVVLVVASFVTSGVLRFISAVLIEGSIWVSIGTIFLPLGLNVVIFALLFRYIPARHVEWDAVWPAAMLGAVGWELAKAAFGWYLANLANYQFVYGGLATGIVLLFWTYLIASIFLFSAELCARLNEWLLLQKGQRVLTGGRQFEISVRNSQVKVEMPVQRNTPPK